MNGNWVMIAFYVFALILTLATGYVVFVLGHSGWWFLFDFVLVGCFSPTDSK